MSMEDWEGPHIGGVVTIGEGGDHADINIVFFDDGDPETPRNVCQATGCTGPYGPQVADFDVKVNGAERKYCGDCVERLLWGMQKAFAAVGITKKYRRMRDLPCPSSNT